MIPPHFVSIGVPVYNNANNVKNLVHGLLATAGSREHFEILVLDDCSPDVRVTDEVEVFCRRIGIGFIRQRQNRGVPAAWNSLCKHAIGEIVLLLNDDVRPSSADWLDAIRSVFELNRTVAVAYWCQKQVDPGSGIAYRHTTDSMHIVSNRIQHPLLRANFCGAFFAVRKSFLSDIRQPDGSTGFWEDLLAYGEEIDLSAECHERGMHILQLPVVWEHLQSQTFAKNPSTRLRLEASYYLPLSEFRQICERYPGVLRDGLPPRLGYRAMIGSLFKHRGASSNIHAVPKLEYSLAMLIKKWEGRRVLGDPGGEYIRRLLTDGFPTALRQATLNDGTKLPATIRFRHRGIESTATLEQCLSDTSDSLI